MRRGSECKGVIRGEGGRGREARGKEGLRLSRGRIVATGGTVDALLILLDAVLICPRWLGRYNLDPLFWKQKRSMECALWTSCALSGLVVVQQTHCLRINCITWRLCCIVLHCMNFDLTVYWRA